LTKKNYDTDPVEKAALKTQIVVLQPAENNWFWMKWKKLIEMQQIYLLLAALANLYRKTVKCPKTGAY